MFEIWGEKQKNFLLAFVQYGKMLKKCQKYKKSRNLV